MKKESHSKPGREKTGAVFQRKGREVYTKRERDQQQQQGDEIGS